MLRNLRDLIKLANHLDSKGLTKESDYLDRVISKYSMAMLESTFDMLTENQSSKDEKALEQLKVSTKDWLSREPDFRKWVNSSARAWRKTPYAAISDDMVNVLFPRNPYGSEYSKIKGFDNYDSDDIDYLINPIIVAVRQGISLSKKVEESGNKYHRDGFGRNALSKEIIKGSEGWIESIKRLRLDLSNYLQVTRGYDLSQAPLDSKGLTKEADSLQQRYI